MLLNDAQMDASPPLITTPSQITQTSADIEVLEAALWRLSRNYGWLEVCHYPDDSADVTFYKDRILEMRDTFDAQGDIIHTGIILCKQAETSQINIAEARGITQAIELASAIMKKELSKESL